MQYAMNSAKNAITTFKKKGTLNYLTDHVMSARYVIFELAKLEVEFYIKNYGLRKRPDSSIKAHKFSLPMCKCCEK